MTCSSAGVCVPEESQKKCHVDVVLDKFSLFGRFHLQVMLLVSVAFLTNAMYAANYVFAAHNVQYRCKDEGYENVSTCSFSNNTGCSEWEYDEPNSFVAEFGLACQEWKRTLVGTAHSVGYMIGLLMVGPMSDRIGRKRAVVITGVLGAVFGVARSFTSWYWFYIALAFLESAIGDICSPTYVLQMEIVSARNKIKFNMLCNLGFIAGGVLLALFAWLVPYWRTFLQVIYTPAFLFFFYHYLLDESPRWLLMRGKKDEATHILQKAAKKSKVVLDKNVLDNLYCEAEERVGFLDLLAMTFKSKILRLRFIVCVIWWNTSTFVHYGMVINSVSLPGNQYVNYGLTALIEIPGTLLTGYILQNFNRKRPLIFAFFLGGLLCLVQPFIPVDQPWLAITMFLLGKLLTSMYFGITYVYTSELFPTYTRNSMHALCSSLGRIGNIVAPQTPLLLSIWSGLPTVVFGLVAVVAGLATLLVPDVRNDVLPDTVLQAEALGKPKTPAVPKDFVNNAFEDSNI